MDSKVNQGSRSNEIDMLNGPLFRKILVFEIMCSRVEQSGQQQSVTGTF